MPNGFYGLSEIWTKAERVLNAIETLLSECLQDRKATINWDHSWPTLSVEWTAGNLQRKLLIFLSNVHRTNVHLYSSLEKELTYDVRLCASKGTGGTGPQHAEFLRQNVSWEALSREIRDVLMQAVQIVESWTVDDLAPGPKV